MPGPLFCQETFEMQIKVRQTQPCPRGLGFQVWGTHGHTQGAAGALRAHTEHLCAPCAMGAPSAHPVRDQWVHLVGARCACTLCVSCARTVCPLCALCLLRVLALYIRPVPTLLVHAVCTLRAPCACAHVPPVHALCVPRVPGVSPVCARCVPCVCTLCAPRLCGL